MCRIGGLQRTVSTASSLASSSSSVDTQATPARGGMTRKQCAEQHGDAMLALFAVLEQGAIDVVRAADTSLNKSELAVTYVTYYLPNTLGFGGNGYSVYFRTKWRYCHKVGTEHQSNTVHYTLDAERGFYTQSCFSRHGCENKKAHMRQIPADVLERMRAAVANYKASTFISFSSFIPASWSSVS
jgi:hypothetical protein